MVTNIASVLGAFATTNKMTIHNLNTNVDRLTQQILDMQKKFDQEKAQVQRDHQKQLHEQ